MRAQKKHAKQANDLQYMMRFMSSLHEDQARLRDIQSVYDNLTLLGQLLCAGTDITSMRTDFNTLAGVLLDQLATELHKKAVLSLGSNARVAIDLLVRNLFERTADIGFLATDEDIRRFAEAAGAGMAPEELALREAALRARFDEYVRKYSVYHNIILLAPDGRVLAQLDGTNPVAHSRDPLIGESLTTDKAYVETFRATDLLPREEAPLIYSYRVMSEDGSQPVGVLCLCFRFQDECERIFGNLVAEDDWTVVTLLDQDGRVIASSDIYQFPVGAKLERVLDEECRIVRFAGREYLATTRPTHGYQGYMGPGWVGHALAPLNHAFEMAAAHELDAVPRATLDGVLDTATLFSPQLRDIPVKAASIQRELNRAVWNGNIWLSRDNYAFNTSFAKVLLWEIGSTGVRTRNVFGDSTANLYETVVSSVLYDAKSQAALAMDIMDRNLYERANDCRWWALTDEFRSILAAGTALQPESRERLSAILRTINGLYTVYSNLLVFDMSARVVAVSNPAYTDMVGSTLQAEWMRQTLALPDTQSYCVSAFSNTQLYAGHPTYVYSAAIRHPEGKEPVGGIAIVFDSTPQFVAMLQDALPRNESGEIVKGAFAVFAERDGRIIASTDAELVPGTRLEIGREFFELEPGGACANIVTYRGRYYAVGSRVSSGYREYKGEEDSYRNDVVALVLVPLSDTVAATGSTSLLRAPAGSYTRRPTESAETEEIATFHIGHGWYGVRSRFVLEAIDGQTITPIPGTPEWVKGCVMHNDRAITIFDLGGFLPGHPGTSGSQIVIIRLPDQEMYFGILVDELGEIPEIASNRLEPVPMMMSSGTSLTESLVKPHPEDTDKRILVILSVERMLQRVMGLPMAESTGEMLQLGHKQARLHVA